MRFDLIENNQHYLKLILTLTYLLRIVTITPNNPKHPETSQKIIQYTHAHTKHYHLTQHCKIPKNTTCMVMVIMGVCGWS